MPRVQLPVEVREANGDPINGATIIPTIRGGGAATHYSLEVGGTSSTAGFNTDTNGRAVRWFEPGSYNLAISKTGRTAVNRAFDAARGDGVTLIADNTIKNPQFADQSITSSKITSNAITLSKWGTRQVTESKLADNAISARTVVASSVKNAAIADDAVGVNEIADRSIGVNEINSGAVGGGTIGTNELANLAVTTAKLNDGSVLTTHLMSSAVTQAKLGPNSITGSNIANSAILPAMIKNEVLPLGMIVGFGGAGLPPTEWKIADGTAISRSTYAGLFTLIATTFGAGDGSSTYNLPDLRGRSPMGVGSHSWINVLGKTDNLSTALRGPKHGHDVGSVTMNNSGGHEHYYYQPVNLSGDYYGVSNGPDHVYDSNYLAANNVDGAHPHYINGVAGDTADSYFSSSNNDNVHHQVIRFIIKVL